MNGKRVMMIIDQDEEDVLMFRKALSIVDNNAAFYSAPNGIEALILLWQKIKMLPDFIFLNMNIEKMTGEECLINLKNHLSFRHIPVIMYSTALTHDHSHFRNLGALSVIVKPSTFANICKVVAGALH